MLVLLAFALHAEATLSVQITPASYDFGSVAVGSSVSMTATVTNSGASALTFREMSFDAAATA